MWFCLLVKAGSLTQFQLLRIQIFGWINNLQISVEIYFHKTRTEVDRLNVQQSLLLFKIHHWQFKTILFKRSLLFDFKKTEPLHRLHPWILPSLEVLCLLKWWQAEWKRDHTISAFLKCRYVWTCKIITEALEELRFYFKIFVRVSDLFQ